MSLFDNITTYIQQHKTLADTIHQDEVRAQALTHFMEKMLPHRKLEAWRESSVLKAFEPDYNIHHQEDIDDKTIESIFDCDINISQFDNYKTMNGILVSNHLLEEKPNGIIIGSIKEAKKQYPEIFAQHYNKITPYDHNGITAINTALAENGIFIYVPDNVKVEQPIRIVNITHYQQNTFTQYRNLVVLGKNSELSIIQCDDTTNHQSSITNVVSEFFIDESANLNHYKLQNINDNSSLINTVFFKQQQKSNVLTQTITLNGGNIRNETTVSLEGTGSHADVIGLYLADKEQNIENQVKINHKVEKCTSNQAFKGILDDHAHALFNGYIFVDRDAQKTEAFQNCNNIAVSDKATVSAQPFLEIYADDVKCSHGATIGQIDEKALFYLRTRGINKDDAKLLLFYAFAAELLDFIKHPLFKEAVDDMIKKRLRGEFSSCNQCVLLCNNPEHRQYFDIDLSEI